VAGTFLRVQDQLGWAKQRVADVRDTVAALGAAEGSVFSVELHPRAETRQAIRVVWSPEANVEITDGLAHRVDDAVHNLRVTLDRLIYELAIRRRGGFEPASIPPGHQLRKTAFPIFDDPVEYDGKGKGRGARDALAALKVDQRKRIRALQPFGRPGHPLAMLRDLDNEAKHRRASVLVRLDDVDFDRRIGDRYGLKVAEGVRPRRRYRHGATVVVLTTRSFDPDRTAAAVNAAVRRQLSVVFGPGSPAAGRDVVAELRRLQTHVSRTLSAFRKDFPI
jgi:hypothetical protein